MPRQIAPLFLLTVALLGGSARGSEPVRKANPEYQKNWQTFGIKGRVQSLKETEDKRRAPGIQPRNLEQLWFGPSGNLTRQVTTREGEYYGDQRYTYDAAGNYEQTEHYKEDGTLKFTTRNTFNANGKVVEYAEFTGAARVTYRRTETYVKDTPEEQVVEWRQTVPATRPGDVMKHVTRFDAQGRKLLHEVSRGSEAPTEKALYQYRPDNTVEVTESSYSQGSGNRLTSTRIIVYDAAKRVLSRKVFSVAYPENNFELSVKYDAAGNITEETLKNAKGLDEARSYRNKYSYDRQGNWVRRVTSSLKGKYRGSVVRRIEYYSATTTP
ncbi:hypothetical protein [Corallococcus macrosporus]|uniref:YD repeat-containing protein n=1 Tax=Myxococcus fulvus (strain ATCC BAA-855 / HW-1) TaxID=483219 RepID=F8CC13_MYXFH|nr:hypothetical protein [Corallococcus macrosporus]AEI67170.1 hypothetical protein LILAB_26390 [Corallococcus macrosporus]